MENPCGLLPEHKKWIQLLATKHVFWPRLVLWPLTVCYPSSCSESPEEGQPFLVATKLVENILNHFESNGAVMEPLSWEGNKGDVADIKKELTAGTERPQTSDTQGEKSFENVSRRHKFLPRSSKSFLRLASECWKLRHADAGWNFSIPRSDWQEVFCFTRSTLKVLSQRCFIQHGFNYSTHISTFLLVVVFEQTVVQVWQTFGFPPANQPPQGPLKSQVKMLPPPTDLSPPGKCHPPLWLFHRPHWLVPPDVSPPLMCHAPTDKPCTAMTAAK